MHGEATAIPNGRSSHRAFLNRYYGASRFLYDATRKYYLFGRDAVVRDLIADSSWRRLIEMGPGTGRNLRALRRRRPDAILGGVEASDAMLSHAKARCPWAHIEHGFAEDAPLQNLLSAPPDRVLFSYCLSMVTDAPAALVNARRALSPDGELVVVDFGDLRGLPSRVERGFRSYLEAFHVTPVDDQLLEEAESVTYGPFRYFVVARFGPMNAESAA